MRRDSEALTRQTELWSLPLLDRAGPLDIHPLLTRPVSLHFKYATWTRQVALLGRGA